LSLRAAKAFLQEHCRRQGIFDKRESALSPARRIGFLKLTRWTDDVGHCPIIMAAPSPVLMAGRSAAERSETGFFTR
jgi:predicted ATPase